MADINKITLGGVDYDIRDVSKVDKVTGKGLSTNDYTDAEKTKVSSIDSKVDKVTGKELSTNDYTTAEKTKLAGIAEGATVGATTEQAQAITDLAQKLGDLDDLETTDKTSLVAAINEAAQSGGITDEQANKIQFMSTIIVELEEDGLCFVDSELNIGVIIDENGIKAKNLLEYEIVNNE